jgi:small subunit ribosomal protein S14
MARKAMMEKASKMPKFKVRSRNRCLICGRPRGYMESSRCAGYAFATCR